jgi:methyl-accepting chemotaxis protein
MNRFGVSHEKISTIVKVTDEIAFQTNIFALSAAVEAAPGRDGGRFADVAEEVPNLDQRRAQAAREASALIEESIRQCGLGSQKLDSVAQSVHHTANGTASASRALAVQAQSLYAMVDRLRLLAAHTFDPDSNGSAASATPATDPCGSV